MKSRGIRPTMNSSLGSVEERWHPAVVEGIRPAFIFHGSVTGGEKEGIQIFIALGNSLRQKV